MNQRLRELEIYKQDNLSLVSLVGVGMASHVGVAGRVFSVLAQHAIHPVSYTHLILRYVYSAADAGRLCG